MTKIVRHALYLTALVAGLALSASAMAQTLPTKDIAQADRTPTPVTDPTAVPLATNVVATPVTQGLEAPWGMAFLPNGDLLVTELLGQLRVIGKNGQLEERPIAGVPPVATGGQGGLMDVTLHPDFQRNSLVYLSHSAGDESASWTRVIRGELRGRTLSNVRTIFEVSQKKPRLQHNGSRFAWLPDKTLLITIGDGGNPPTMLEGALIREQAQNLDSHLGKIIRVHDDGRVPADNPFLDRPDAKREIYSYGHRNAQGLARDPVSGLIWSTEHGSQGGDELNLIKPGANYGWPRVAHAVEYGRERTPISPHRSLPGMEDPKAVWVPAIAPGGITVYRGSVYPGWDGDVMASALRVNGRPNAGAMLRINVEGENVVGQERIDLGAVRVRDVETGPDGKLYVLTTAIENYRDRGQRNGALIRLDPK
jgi:aldose sugar dehydrogenase